LRIFIQLSKRGKVKHTILQVSMRDVGLSYHIIGCTMKPIYFCTMYNGKVQDFSDIKSIPALFRS